MIQINTLSIIDTFASIGDAIWQLGSLIVEFIKYVLLVPGFIRRVVDFCFIIISFIPEPFRSIELVFVSLLIGFFTISLIAKVIG